MNGFSLQHRNDVVDPWNFVDTIRNITPNSNIRLLTNGRMPSTYWEKNGRKFDSIQFSFHARQTDINKFKENFLSYQKKQTYIRTKPITFLDLEKENLDSLTDLIKNYYETHLKMVKFLNESINNR